MSALATALADLEDEERYRVLRWAADRYGVTLSSSGRASGNSGAPAGGVGEAPAGGNGAEDMDDDDVTEGDIAAEAPTFEHFAELFAAAQPKTNEDKALVAAYWIQALQGQDKWQSRALTTQLKHLGHAIPNITDALSSNMRKKPQRVIQLQKAGNSRQAQKVYKVTHEGLVYVQGMLGHGS